MKNLLFTILFLSASIQCSAQLTLEKTYLITEDNSYIVPNGKIWLVTSMEEFSVMVSEGFTFISAGTVAQIVKSSAGEKTPYVSFPIWLNSGSRVIFGCTGKSISVSEYSE